MNKNQVILISGCFLDCKKLLKFLSLILWLALAPLSWAQTCAPTSDRMNLSMGSSVTLNSTPAHGAASKTVYPAGNALAPTLSAGNETLIFSNADSPSALCRFWQTYVEAVSGAVLVAGVSYNGAPVFKTKITGIGYSVRAADARVGTFVAMPATGKVIVHTDPKGKAGATLWKPGFKSEVTFVATGEPIPLGTHVIDEVVGILSAENKKGEILAGAKSEIRASATFIVPALTCAVESGSQLKLELPEVSVNLVKQWSIGTENAASPESTKATTKMSCPPGIALWGTFVDANNKSNVSNILSVVKNAGAAEGVGIILFRQQGSAGTGPWTQVSYGPESSMPGNTNQWQLARVYGEKRFTFLNIKAKYVRTGVSVTGGSVQGRSIVVLSYQ